MKKALIVTRVSGFVPQFEMQNVKRLQQMGYQIHYAANYDTIVYGEDNSRLDQTGIICHQIPFGRSPYSPKVISCYRQLKQLMLSEKFDLVHCHMPMTGVITRLAAQSVRRKTGRKIPILYTTHGFHFYTGAPITNWLYYLPERWLARYTDRLITINEEDYRRAQTFHVRGRVEKIPGVGIEIDDMLSPESRRRVRQQKRRELGLTESDFVMISVGELNMNKNQLQIINMLAMQPDGEIRYVICGEGPMRQQLSEAVKKAGLDDQVVFIGYSQEVPGLLAAADLFVFPSLREGLSVALMEAMRAGLPIVANKIRGNVDLIEDGKGGYLLEEGNVEEYAEAVQSLKIDSVRREEMGKWNQERVREYSAEIVGERMRQIYEEVLCYR